jgi:predicted DNA-binding transcriptional regulator AlpA
MASFIWRLMNPNSLPGLSWSSTVAGRRTEIRNWIRRTPPRIGFARPKAV